MNGSPELMAPDDFKLIAKQFANPRHIRMLRGLRCYLHIRGRVAAKVLRMSSTEYFHYERMRRMMPIAKFVRMEEFIISELEEREKLPQGCHPRCSWSGGGRIERAVRFAKQGMTPSQILCFYRDMLHLSVPKIVGDVGYSIHYVRRLFEGAAGYRPVYEAVKKYLVERFEQECDYDEYY